MSGIALKRNPVQNHVLVSKNPSYRTDSGKLSGVELEGDNYAYCYQRQSNNDSWALSQEACERQIDKANEDNLPNLSVWGLDLPGADMPDAKESGLAGIDKWQGLSKFQDTLESFDRGSTKLEEVEGLRNAADNYSLTDAQGHSLDIANDALGRGVQVSKDNRQLEYGKEDMGALVDLMRTGAKNSGNAEELKSAIDAISKSKPFAY